MYLRDSQSKKSKIMNWGHYKKGKTRSIKSTENKKRQTRFLPLSRKTWNTWSPPKREEVHKNTCLLNGGQVIKHNNTRVGGGIWRSEKKGLPMVKRTRTREHTSGREKVQDGLAGRMI